MTKKKILLIEDEKHIAEAILLNLRLSGYEVTWASNGQIGLEKWSEFRPDLIILDLMMPQLDGHKVIEVVREKDLKIPILILSAKDSSREKVKCFTKGVDDYLSKPFDLDEFLLRVERLLTRAEWYQQENSLSVDEFHFDQNWINFQSRKASGLNGEFSPTQQELELLKVFVQNINVPLERKEILKAAFHYTDETETRTLDNFIVRFRKYFEVDPKRPKYFKSVRSVGYIFEVNSKN